VILKGNFKNKGKENTIILRRDVAIQEKLC
jgi:hypothetical protein